MKLTRKLLFLCLGACVYCRCWGLESDVARREYQLKTAYIFHFAELTEWPALLPTTICVMGGSPLSTYLPALEGHQVNHLELRVMLAPPAIDECRILFLGDSAALTQPLLQQAIDRHILLVSDAENFAVTGGMIQFTLRDNRLKLVVNLNSVRQAGLKLSSKLLRMAEILE